MGKPFANAVAVGEAAAAFPPNVVAVRLEFCIEQRMLQAHGVDGTTGDFEIHLHIDVGRTRVLKCTTGTKQLGDESAQHHKLRPGAIMVNDAHERLLGSSACLPASRNLIGHERPPTDAPQLPRPERPR
jgi:hypothetical protein